MQLTTSNNVCSYFILTKGNKRAVCVQIFYEAVFGLYNKALSQIFQDICIIIL